MQSLALVFWSCSWDESSQKLFPDPEPIKKMKSDCNNLSILHLQEIQGKREQFRLIYMICRAQF